jgi:hypothetical protein
MVKEREMRAGNRWAGPIAAVATALLAVSGPAAAATPGLDRVTAPKGGSADAIRSVSFASPSLGWAAGSAGVSLSGTGVDRLLLSWDGSRWQKVALDAIASSDESLNGVVAVSPTEAWAVGGQNPYGINDDLPVLLHYNGSTWASAGGAFSVGRLWAVAASSASNVWALGTQLERYDGRGWHLVAARAVTDGTKVRRVAIAATSPNDAWIAGSSFTRKYSGPGQALIEHWNGTQWAQVALPPTNTDDRLTSIAARSASDVWAVGFSSGAPLTLHFDGSGWRRITAAPTSQNGAFEAVAVGGAGAVWAVGHEDGVDSRDYAVWRPVAQRWTGTAWQKVRTPVVGDYDAWFGGVALTGGQAWAVGANQGSLVAHSPST